MKETSDVIIFRENNNIGISRILLGDENNTNNDSALGEGYVIGQKCF